MPVINQPFQGQLGEIIKQTLTEPYDEFTIFSAFAKNSGVLRLKPSLEDFHTRGGIINAFIGIDLDGTSYEALLNLFSLCDNLYVIHSENPHSTYHSKIYMLRNTYSAWCAIGSNNLTGGGLWTNFESCSIQEFNLNNPNEEINSIDAIIAQYSDPAYPCSTRITSIEDIDRLLEANYITKEVTQRMHKVKREKQSNARQTRLELFGRERVSIPTIVSIDQPHTSTTPVSQTTHAVDYVFDAHPNTPAFTNEQFWFEMRESTGGSRNILDLSKLGRIASGSVSGTPYEYTDSTKMYGGVKFFEIDPEDTSRTKNITINYRGKDYFPSTIKFAPNNGSWRIQLKGEPNDGTDELSKFGNRGDFVHKILVFEKINDSYYVLSLLDETELQHLKDLSRVWALNGSSRNSKAYGML